jgi:hypothetical protein
VTISVFLEFVTYLTEDNYYKPYWDKEIIAEQTVMANMSYIFVYNNNANKICLLNVVFPLITILKTLCGKLVEDWKR